MMIKSTIAITKVSGFQRRRLQRLLLRMLLQSHGMIHYMRRMLERNTNVDVHVDERRVPRRRGHGDVHLHQEK